METSNRNSSNHLRPRHSVIISIILFILVFVSFAVGYMSGKEQALAEYYETRGGGEVLVTQEHPPAYLSRDVDFDLFWNVWNSIRDYYINEKDVPDTQLFYGSLAGMVASLKDPYSVFLDPEMADKFNKELEGTFEGIGAEIGIKKDRLTIIAPLAGSPAEKAGLRPGDKVFAIDGLDTTGIPIDKAVSLIRGPKNTEVVLTVGRDGLESVQDIKIIRDKIEVKSVSWEFRPASGSGTSSDSLVYVKIMHFSEDTTSLFSQAAQEILNQNAKGIILDLRNNPGGYLDAAVEIASEWIEDGPVVIEQRTDAGDKHPYPAEGQARLKHIPTVVLVNEGSASGSEIVAGALQDHGIARLIGKKTFGKGSVQELQQLPDGSSLKLTVAKWLTPKGRSINEEGIVPDIEVDLTDKDYNEDRDPQLDAAVKALSTSP